MLVGSNFIDDLRSNALGLCISSIATFVFTVLVFLFTGSSVDDENVLIQVEKDIVDELTLLLETDNIDDVNILDITSFEQNLTGNPIIVIFGEFISSENLQNFVTILQRGQTNIFDFLIDRKDKMVISYVEVFDMVDISHLHVSTEAVDISNDFQKEIVISISSLFPDSVSRSALVFKSIGDTWDFIPFPNLNPSAQLLFGGLHDREALFYQGPIGATISSNENVYSFRLESIIDLKSGDEVLENSIFLVASFGDGECTYCPRHYFTTSMYIRGNEFRPNVNWNRGRPMIGSPINRDENNVNEVSFEELGELVWNAGINNQFVGNLFFYNDGLEVNYYHRSPSR